MTLAPDETKAVVGFHGNIDFEAEAARTALGKSQIPNKSIYQLNWGKFHEFRVYANFIPNLDRDCQYWKKNGRFAHILFVYTFLTEIH